MAPFPVSKMLPILVKYFFKINSKEEFYLYTLFQEEKARKRDYKNAEFRDLGLEKSDALLKFKKFLEDYIVAVKP